MTFSHACKQKTKKIDAEQFIAWVGQSVPSCKKIVESDRTNQTAKLREQDANVDMCITVCDIPESAEIIRPDQAGQWRVLQEGSEKKWDSLCDYLILWESDGEILAVFIELKATSPHPRGKFQLVWAIPMLHHLWINFAVDNCVALTPPKPTIVCRHIEIGDKKNARFAKQPVRQSTSPYFHTTTYKRVTINYSTRKCLSVNKILAY